jgi:hypothetical protein
MVVLVGVLESFNPRMVDKICLLFSSFIFHAIFFNLEIVRRIDDDDYDYDDNDDANDDRRSESARAIKADAFF